MERIEDLQCRNLKIIQDDTLYTFTSDSVVLANFVKIKKGETALEIGTGCGVISILLTAKTEVEEILAFEIQKEMYKLAKKNVLLNGLESKIDIINDDIKNARIHISNKKFDVVFSNPPFMNSSFGNSNLVKNIARHDDFLSPEELCKCASDLLNNKGRFYFCYLPERIDEIFSCLSKYKLQPKKMFFTENNKREIKLCVIEACKNAKKGIKVLPNLVLNNEDGTYIEKLHTKYF